MRVLSRPGLLVGLALAAAGEFGLTGLGTGTSWPRMAVIGVRSSCDTSVENWRTWFSLM